MASGTAGTCLPPSCNVSATVTVPSQTTLSLNTSALTWTPTSLPATNLPANQTVTGNISTNDPSGYSITVTAGQLFNNAVTATVFPSTANLSVQGNANGGAFQTFTTPSANPVVTSDTSGGAIVGTITDAYDLSIPNVAPGSYLLSGGLTYAVFAN
jgi:hypothetical protein